eukprot:2324216-Rhodomonas_salina.1
MTFLPPSYPKSATVLPYAASVTLYTLPTPYLLLTKPDRAITVDGRCERSLLASSMRSWGAARVRGVAARAVAGRARVCRLLLSLLLPPPPRLNRRLSLSLRSPRGAPHAGCRLRRGGGRCAAYRVYRREGGRLRRVEAAVTG